MGKYKHEGKGRNISVGGGQERKDLFKDMSGGYNAMGDSNSPNYKYNGSAFKQRYSSPMEKYGPLHGNAFGHAMQKAGGDYEKAKSMLDMKGSHSPMYGYESDAQRKAVHASKADGGKGNPNKMKGSPMYKSGCISGGSSKSPYNLMGDPKKKLKGKINKLSGKHKKLYDAYEQGQKVDMDKLGRVEDKLEKKEKKYSKKYGSSPYSMMDNPTAKPKSKPKSKGKTQKEGRLKATVTKKMQKRGLAIGASAAISAPKTPLNKDGKVKKAVRKAKKYIKAKDSVKKQEEKGNYNSFRDEGTKKAKRKVKKASKKHDKMRKAVDKLSTSEKKEALKRFKNK